MTTAGYFAKRRIIDRLQMATGPGQRLDGVQVEYAYPAALTDLCVYFGGFSFNQPGTDDVVDGTDVAVNETALPWLYIRHLGGGKTVEQAEARVEEVGDVIGEILRAEPTLLGPNTYTRIVAGRGDYNPTDDGPIVVLAYQLSVSSYV